MAYFLRYNSILDSQYFLGDFSDSENLKTQKPFDIESSFTTYLVSETEVKVNDQSIVLKDNTYTNNLAGSQRSVV
jgi:hypothetical protein